MWIGGFLFYPVECKVTIIIYFDAQIIPGLSQIWAPFKVAPVSF